MPAPADLDIAEDPSPDMTAGSAPQQGSSDGGGGGVPVAAFIAVTVVMLLACGAAVWLWWKRRQPPTEGWTESKPREEKGGEDTDQPLLGGGAEGGEGKKDAEEEGGKQGSDSGAPPAEESYKPPADWVPGAVDPDLEAGQKEEQEDEPKEQKELGGAAPRASDGSDGPGGDTAEGGAAAAAAAEEDGDSEGGGGVRVRVPTVAGGCEVYRFPDPGAPPPSDRPGRYHLESAAWGGYALTSLSESARSEELAPSLPSGTLSELGLELDTPCGGGSGRVIRAVREGSAAERAGLGKHLGRRITTLGGAELCAKGASRVSRGSRLRLSRHVQRTVRVPATEEARKALRELYGAAKGSGAERGGAWPRDPTTGLRAPLRSHAEARRRRESARRRQKAARPAPSEGSGSGESANGYLPAAPERMAPAPPVRHGDDGDSVIDRRPGVCHLGDAGAAALLRDPTRHGAAAVCCPDCGAPLAAERWCPVTGRRHPPQLAPAPRELRLQSSAHAQERAREEAALRELGHVTAAAAAAAAGRGTRPPLCAAPQPRPGAPGEQPQRAQRMPSARTQTQPRPAARAPSGLRAQPPPRSRQPLRGVPRSAEGALGIHGGSDEEPGGTDLFSRYAAAQPAAAARR